MAERTINERMAVIETQMQGLGRKVDHLERTIVRASWAGWIIVVEMALAIFLTTI